MIDEPRIREMLQRRAGAISSTPDHPKAAVRRARRRLAGMGALGVMAIAAILIGVVGGVRALEEANRTGGEPSVTPIPTPDQTPPFDPADAPLAVLPPESAQPSEPAVGELVVSISAENFRNQIGEAPVDEIAQVSVYGDGRVIWARLECPLPSFGPCVPMARPDGGDAPDTHWLEQRLTSEGVELLRSELLRTGMFDEDLSDESNNTGLMDFVTIAVRNGDRLVEVNLFHQSLAVSSSLGPNQIRSLKHAQDILLDLNSWIPDRAWEDRTIRSFIPSRYEMRFYPGPPDDPSDLPAPAGELFMGTCTPLTLDEARAVAAGFEAAGESPIRPRQWDAVAYPVHTASGRAQVLLEPRLPDEPPETCRE